MAFGLEPGDPEVVDFDACSLGVHEPALHLTRGEIAEALELNKMTVANGLEKLIDAGLLLADPPRDVATRGQRVRYTVDDAAVTEMVMRLGQVLGEY